MNQATMFPAREAAHGISILPSFIPVPGLGVLPANAFLVAGSRPVLVDTGLPMLRADFVRAVRTLVDPQDIAWIWLTHTDPDHVGSLAAMLQAAPRARLVTNFLGLAKLDLLGFPTDRVHLVNPGQTLDVGGRELLAVAPPVFDAPETMGFFDARTRTLFSSDCFGALLQAPSLDAADVAPAELSEGSARWARIDAPWLGDVSEEALGRSLARVSALAPTTILSSHLPPARNMSETLIANVAAARSAPAFVGPDHAALQRMLEKEAA